MKKVVALLVVLALVSIAGIATMKEGQEKEAGAEAGLSIKGLRIMNREDGRLLWSFQSEEAVIAENGKLAHLKAVTAVLPDRQTEVNASSGLYNLESKDLVLKGDVIAKIEDSTLNTQELRVKDGRELLAEGRVVFETGSWRIGGEKLRATEKTVVMKNVTAEFF